MTRNGWWWLASLASAITATAGQAEVLPEPARHYVSLAGIACSVLTAVNAHWPKPSAHKKARKRAHR